MALRFCMICCIEIDGERCRALPETRLCGEHAELVERFGGEYVARAGGAEVLEGSLRPGMSVVISQWPDKAAIHAFWDSPEYQEAKLLREGVCDCEVVIVDT